jgi:hypothetical protein
MPTWLYSALAGLYIPWAGISLARPGQRDLGRDMAALRLGRDLLTRRGPAPFNAWVGRHPRLPAGPQAGFLGWASSSPTPVGPVSRRGPMSWLAAPAGFRPGWALGRLYRLGLLAAAPPRAIFTAPRLGWIRRIRPGRDSLQAAIS